MQPRSLSTLLVASSPSVSLALLAALTTFSAPVTETQTSALALFQRCTQLQLDKTSASFR